MESLLREVSRLFVQIQREGLNCCGITPTQCTLLSEVGRAGALTLAELSRRAGLDKGWTSRAVESLVQDGLLTKEAGPADRRTVTISLSPAGAARFEELNRTLNRQAEQLLSRVPAGEQAQVLQALTTLQGALRPGPAATPPDAAPGHAVRYRRAEPGDWDAIAALLTAARLPLAGARHHLGGFLMAHQGDTLVGTAAMELYGEVGLLRSVAVAEGLRSTGLGQELVRLVLDGAHVAGIRSVALLTTTAGKFFPRFGFRRVDRTLLPPALAASEELRGACPASAVPMLLDLRRPAVLVRTAVAADLPDITRIYNQGIEDRSTLETELRTVDERKSWLEGRGERHPVLAAVRRGAVLGWASLNAFSPRHAYRFVADLSVYVERAERGTGIGSALMTGLVDRAPGLGYHKLVLTTFPQMSAAVGLYERFGFRHVGDYREQGQLDGRWQDTRIMELLL